MNGSSLSLAICSMALVGCENCVSPVESASSQKSVKTNSIAGDWPGGAPNRPQEPKLPLPYSEEHVSYHSPEADVILPASRGSFPVVLLMAGSGPIDRDGAVFSHKPFIIRDSQSLRIGR